jgi:hypothetical protein
MSDINDRKHETKSWKRPTYCKVKLPPRRCRFLVTRPLSPLAITNDCSSCYATNKMPHQRKKLQAIGQSTATSTTKPYFASTAARLPELAIDFNNQRNHHHPSSPRIRNPPAGQTASQGEEKDNSEAQMTRQGNKNIPLPHRRATCWESACHELDMCLVQPVGDRSRCYCCS